MSRRKMNKDTDSLMSEEPVRDRTSTRARTIVIATIIGVIVVGSVIGLIVWQVESKDPKPFPIPAEPLARARYLQAQVPLTDGHNDLPWQYRLLVKDDVDKLDISVPQPQLNTDIPRLKEGMLGAQFWSVYVECNTTEYDPVQATMEQIDVVYQIVNKYPTTFQMAFTASQVTDAFNNKRIASLIGMEGGHSINGSLGALRMFYKLGARYMTLTHSCSTPWAQSAHDIEGRKGLTDFGRLVVQEMNKLGMLVDISHVSVQTMHDALDTSQAPVIFSHSNAWALCNNKRNVPDEILKRLPANGGVIMIVFYPGFVCNDTNANCTLANVVDHIDYVKNLIGDDYIGLGSDFDGVPELPIGLGDVSKYVDLTAELVRRKYTDESILKIISKNSMRVLAAAETVAAQLQ